MLEFCRHRKMVNRVKFFTFVGHNKASKVKTTFFFTLTPDLHTD